MIGNFLRWRVFIQISNFVVARDFSLGMIVAKRNAMKSSIPGDLVSVAMAPQNPASQNLFLSK